MGPGGPSLPDGPGGPAEPGSPGGPMGPGGPLPPDTPKMRRLRSGHQMQHFNDSSPKMKIPSFPSHPDRSISAFLPDF